MMKKAALISIHKYFVDNGYLFLAQILLQHLTGLNHNFKVINFLLECFNYPNIH
jgi:hypothetical protein